MFALLSFSEDLTGNAVRRLRSPAIKTQCSDKVDNDLDSRIDYTGYRSYPPDSDCSSQSDKTECGVACSSASNCGTNGWGASYCFNNDKYSDYTTYNCNLPTTCGSYCTNGITPTQIEDCQAKDAKGYCQNGQCFLPAPSNNTIQNSCADSDGGQVLTLKGTASGYLNSFSYSKTDYCLTSTSVHENWCVGDLSYEQNVNCPSGTSCSDGACISTQTNTCLDTDGGFNAYGQGTISGLQNNIPYSSTDYCASSTSIYEYYCISNTPSGFEQSCQGNATNICSNGACQG